MPSFPSAFNVPYEFKDLVKSLGATWDPEIKKWTMDRSHPSYLTMIQNFPLAAVGAPLVCPCHPAPAAQAATAAAPAPAFMEPPPVPLSPVAARKPEDSTDIQPGPLTAVAARNACEAWAAAAAEEPPKPLTAVAARNPDDPLYMVVALTYDSVKGFPLSNRKSGIFENPTAAWTSAFRHEFTELSGCPLAPDMQLLRNNLHVKSMPYYADLLDYIRAGEENAADAGQWDIQRTFLEADLAKNGVYLRDELAFTDLSAWHASWTVPPLLTLRNYLPEFSTEFWPRKDHVGKSYVDLGHIGRQLLDTREEVKAFNRFEHMRLETVKYNLDKFGFTPVWSYLGSGDKVSGMAFICKADIRVL